MRDAGSCLVFLDLLDSRFDFTEFLLDGLGFTPQETPFFFTAHRARVCCCSCAPQAPSHSRVDRAPPDTSSHSPASAEAEPMPCRCGAADSPWPAQTPAASSHRANAPRSCSVKSRHDLPPVFALGSRAECLNLSYSLIHPRGKPPENDHCRHRIIVILSRPSRLVNLTLARESSRWGSFMHSSHRRRGSLKPDGRSCLAVCSPAEDPICRTLPGIKRTYRGTLDLKLATSCSCGCLAVIPTPYYGDFTIAMQWATRDIVLLRLGHFGLLVAFRL